MVVSQPSLIRHIIGPAVLHWGATHAVKLISDAQWKHSSVEYEIVFHVTDAIPAQQRVLPDNNTYSQKPARERSAMKSLQRRIYARPITHFLPCEVACIRPCKVICALLRSSSIITSVKIAFVSEKGA